MIVGFDLTWMDNNNTSGGVYQYAFRVVSAIVEHTEVKVVAIICPEGVGIFDHLKGYENFKAVIFEAAHSFKTLIEAEKIEVVHTPIQYHLNFTLSVPMISTLHDLQPFHYPEFFTEEEIQFRNTYYKKSAEFSELVIVSYQHVKDDIVKFYGIPAEKIAVCPLGMPVIKEVDQSLFYVLKEKYHLPDKYLFYSANLWRHKNHAGLVRALKLVHDKYGIKISLVCTGHKYVDFSPEIEQLIEELGLVEYVNFTGYIPDEDMWLILTQATLAVIPTLYEAGSFPLMEAMTYGVPVICSNITSLPETIGDPRFVFNPNDTDQIAEMINTILTDNVLSNENKANSSKRISSGGWDAAVQYFVRTYEKAVTQFAEIKKQSLYENRLLNFDFFLDEIVRKLRIDLGVSEKDRAARLEVIYSYQQQLQETQAAMSESQADLVQKEEVIQRQTRDIAESQAALTESHAALAESQVALWDKEEVIKILSRAVRSFRIAHFILSPREALGRIARRVFKVFASRLGNLNQHPPIPLRPIAPYSCATPVEQLPVISVVTPSFNQGRFIGRTLLSVLDQDYPKLEYIVQDGGSKDETAKILSKYANRLAGWNSISDNGQSCAINLGFAHTTGEIMAWLNSDDLLLPGALAFVADYFNRHPEVDVVYGNRILIDENDQQIGRWILPGHDSKVLSWADYVPQETLFWRRRIWEKVGGTIDESFRFAMDWDLLVRFRNAGARFAHIPRFLGAFRIHEQQKTSAAISDIGYAEMNRIREREIGRKVSDREVSKALYFYLKRHILYELAYKVKQIGGGTTK